MADTTWLDGRNPYDLQDRECERIASHLASLDAEGWMMPSGCEGWSRRDLLGHLAATEEYFTACLEGSVAQLIQRFMDAGASSLDEFNAAGVAAFAEMASGDLLAHWIDHNRRNRAGFRAADGTDIDSTVGAYPARQQAFHVAFEYAIHAGDLDAPVADAERDERQDWLAAVAAFSLTEVKDAVSVTADGGRLMVSAGSGSVTLDRDAFVAGVSRRLGQASLDAETRDLLDLGY